MTAISDYNSACKAAQTAIEAQQYSAALISFERAWASQLRIADSELDRERLEMPRESIMEAVKYCRKRAIEEGQLTPTGKQLGIRFSEVDYTRG